MYNFDDSQQSPLIHMGSNDIALFGNNYMSCFKIKTILLWLFSFKFLKQYLYRTLTANFGWWPKALFVITCIF